MTWAEAFHDVGIAFCISFGVVGFVYVLVRWG